MQALDGAWLASQICPIAQDAGAAILRIYDRVDQGDALLAHKADDSPLTEADLAAHHCIVQGLAQRTPGIAVVSEEDPHSHAAPPAPGHVLAD